MSKPVARSARKIKEARAKIEPRPYAIDEAMGVLQKTKFSKFDETVELAINLGVDPRHADQMVRGTVVLPNGLGRTIRVCVIAAGEKVKSGRGTAKSWMEDGADYGVATVLVPRVRNRPLYRGSAIVVNMKQKAPPTNELKELKKRAASGKLSNRIYAALRKPKKAAKKK